MHQIVAGILQKRKFEERRRGEEQPREFDSLVILRRGKGAVAGFCL